MGGDPKLQAIEKTVWSISVANWRKWIGKMKKMADTVWPASSLP